MSKSTGTRWCDGCKHDHGILYECPTYPAALREAIHAESIEFEASVRAMPNSPMKSIFLFFMGER